jgi:hypothetical protein
VPLHAVSTILTAILADTLWCGTPKNPSHGSLPLPSSSSLPASPAPSHSLLAASRSVPALTLLSSSFSMSSRPSQTSNTPWPACLQVVPIVLIIFTTLTPVIFTPPNFAQHHSFPCPHHCVPSSLSRHLPGCKHWHTIGFLVLTIVNVGNACLIHNALDQSYRLLAVSTI